MPLNVYCPHLLISSSSTLAPILTLCPYCLGNIRSTQAPRGHLRPHTREQEGPEGDGADRSTGQQQVPIGKHLPPTTCFISTHSTSKKLPYQIRQSICNILLTSLIIDFSVPIDPSNYHRSWGVDRRTRSGTTVSPHKPQTVLCSMAVLTRSSCTER